MSGLSGRKKTLHLLIVNIYDDLSLKLVFQKLDQVTMMEMYETERSVH